MIDIGNNFDEKTHTYRIDGKRATGVTTIIGVLAKPQLVSWSARVATEYIDGFIKEVAIHADWASVFEDGTWERIVTEAKIAHTKKKESAGLTGTDRHSEVEEWINLCLKSDGKPNFAMPHTTDIKQFVDWAVENVDHFLFSERQMYNKELFIAGTADFAYVGKDGRKYIGDFKTSSGIYGADYFLQVAAYRLLAESEGDDPYDGMAIVRLGKDGKFEVQYLYEYESFRDGFLACLKLYRLQASVKDLVIKE